MRPPAEATPDSGDRRIDVAALYTQREMKGSYVVSSKACGFRHKLSSSKRIEFGGNGNTAFQATYSGDGFSGPVQIETFAGGLRFYISARNTGAVTSAQTDGFNFNFYIPHSEIGADGSFVARHDSNSFRASRCADYKIEFTAR